MSETNAPYLHIVRATDQDEESEQASGAREDTTSASAASDAPEQEGVLLNAPLQQAIMYAAVSWVALVTERTVHSVDIQPIGRRLYEVSVHYAAAADAQGAQDADDGIILLRVGLEVEPGLIVRMVVEPVRP